MIIITNRTLNQFRHIMRYQEIIGKIEDYSPRFIVSFDVKPPKEDLVRKGKKWIAPDGHCAVWDLRKEFHSFEEIFYGMPDGSYIAIYDVDGEDIRSWVVRFTEADLRHLDWYANTDEEDEMQ